MSTTNLSLQQILNETQQYSELSQQPSFTLTDILQQPIDDQIMDDNYIQEENIQNMFGDQDDESMFQEEGSSAKLKPYEFPKLQNQIEKQLQKDEGNVKNISSESLINAEGSMKQTAQGFINNQQLQSNSQNPSNSVKASNNKKFNPSQKGISAQNISKLKSLTSSKRYSQNSQASTRLVQINKHDRLSSMPMLPLQQINNMSYVLLKNVTSLFEDSTNTTIGIPTAISATGNRFLAVGTSMGNIVLFQIGIKGHKVLGTTQQRKFGYISSLSISRDNKYLVAGHQSGLVAVWDLYYFNIFKQQINSKSKIFQVLFCSQTSQNFISNDIQGNTYIYTIQKYIWTNLKSQKLLQKSPLPFYDIRYHELQTKSSLLAMCTLDYVLLISIKPQIKMIGRVVRPQGIGMSYIPNVQMGRCFIDGTNNMRTDIKPMYDVLLVSWGKVMYVYRLMPSTAAYSQLQQLYIYKHPTGIYNIEYLSENVFVTLDNRQIFRTIRIDISISSALQTLEEIDKNYRSLKEKQNSDKTNNFITKNSALPSKAPSVSCSIIHTKQMIQQIIYQRLIKTKQQKYIKSFTNTIVNCTLNTQHKQMFFITKNCIFRGRLHKWTTFLTQMVNEQKNLKMALKLAIQLKNQRLNIFTQKVDLIGKKGQKSINMFCQIGKIFIQQQLKQIKKVNIDRSKNYERAQVQVKQISFQLKQLYQYTIQYFIELKCQRYLFEQIYGKIIKKLPSYQYWNLFFDSLKPFINAQKLVRIPSIQIFKEILEYFSQTKSNSPDEDNMKLIDKMIINLESDSLHYQNAVSLLSENKLYKALAYMCSVNKDFISPCNKLKQKIVQSNQQNRQNAQKQYFLILQQYLTKLINGFYINDKKISQRIYQSNVLRDVCLWISFEDTLQYFLKTKQKQFIQVNQRVQLPVNLRILLQWISKLLLQSAKIRQKHIFHEMVKHLIQSLDSVQKKQIMKKVTLQNKQKINKKDLVTYFKYQLALMIQKYSLHTDLNQFQLTFYVKNIYLCEISQYKSLISHIQFTQITLIQQLTFMNKYFMQLHLVQLPQFTKSQQIPSAYAKICTSSRKNDRAKYLYNFLTQSLNKKNMKKSQNQQQFLAKQNQQNQVSVKDQIIQNQQTDLSILPNMSSKSEQILQTSNIRSSYQSNNSQKQPKSSKFLEDIFSQPSNKYFDVFAQSTLIKRRKELTARMKQLKLFPLILSTSIQQQNDSISRAQNYTLVNFITKHFSFQQIDPNIESLLRLNSQTMIVYILQNYQLDIVNKKIQQIQDEEIKYFVVRRIIKELRRLKLEKDRKRIQQEEQRKNRSFKGASKVWGNQFRSYSKKKQSFTSSKINHKSLFIDFSSTSNVLQKPIILFYLNCLSKFKRQKRVLSQLKHHMQQYQFYIPDILLIVQQHKLNSCIGLLFQQMHQLDKAFQYYQLVYNQRMDVNTHKLALKQHCHGRFLRQIFNQMLDLCQLMNTVEQWMRLLKAVLEPLIQKNKYQRRRKQQVIDLIQFVYTNNPNHTFIQQFGQVIQITLLQVSSNTPTQKISTVFSQYSQLMNKTFMLNCLKSTMHTYSKTIFIYQISNKMVINDQASEFQNIYKQNKIKGVGYLPICQYCNQIIELRDNIIAYKCSHMYHKRCIDPQQDKCKKCVLIQVGEIESMNHYMFELEQLKNKKKQESNFAESNRKIGLPEQQKGQQKIGYNQQQEKAEKMLTIYKCLAFDQYLQKQEDDFNSYREDYESYLSRYE